MKLRPVALALAAVAMLLTGCWQKSIYAFYKTSDVIFDDALLGDWREQKNDPKDGMAWTFTRGGGTNTYLLKVVDDDENAEFDARLFKLGQDRMLDLHSRHRSIGDIPAHNLFRIVELGGSLKMQTLDPEFVQKWIVANPKDISFITINDPKNPDDKENLEYVLAAGTERLQKFVLEHTSDKSFWSDVTELKKAN